MALGIERNMSKNKSIDRSKKTTFTVAEILAKEGLTAIIPGCGFLYDSAKALFNHGKQYYKDRTEDRLEEFHQAILTGDMSEEETTKFLEKEFVLDDYYAVLSSCVQDIESEKVRIYSHLMRSLIDRVLDSAQRRHFITSVKSLSYSDLCFLKDLYINSKYDLMTVGGSAQQLKELLSVSGPFRGQSIKNLASHSFIKDDKSGITEMAESFVSSIFSVQELLPESIGRKPWTGINIVIVSFCIGDKLHDTIAFEVQEFLWSRQVKSSIHVLDERKTSASLIYGAGVLLVSDGGLKDEQIEAVRNFSKKRPLVRLNLNRIASNVELKDVDIAGELTLQSNDVDKIRQDIDKYILTIMT